MLSILTPAFNEAANLPLLHERLVAVMADIGGAWEWLIVDDHSRDDTFAVIQRLALVDARVRGLRLARNSGSHAAIACGLHHVRGEAAVMMAADLQDPPETLGVMLERWRAGAQIVWASRRTQPGDRSHAGFAALYYWIMRRVVGLTEMPARGADFFLVDRAVIDAFGRFPERHVSVLALLTSLGFRQDSVEYDKRPRERGQSGWTLRKKVRLVVDSITAFSAFPIRWCFLAGVLLLGASLLVGVASLLTLPALGGGILFVLAVMLGLTAIQLVALGVVGEYVWRALEEARRRPPYLIEAIAGEDRVRTAGAGHPIAHRKDG